MHYKEIMVPDHFSKQIEIYWEMETASDESSRFEDLLLPDCTFNIIFINQPLYTKGQVSKDWKLLKAGVYFMGQRNTPILLKSKQKLRIFGIRFKPFAFARIFKVPIHQFTDQVFSLRRLFDFSPFQERWLKDILSKIDVEERIEAANALMLSLFEDSLEVDQTLRAQLNYIMDRKGLIKVQDLLSEFGVSKVTLHKHFVNKIGLSPKKISRIWRMNYFLQLKDYIQEENLTSLCLRCGFYDQAHFIKEFKSMLGTPPRQFFEQKSDLIEFSRYGIGRRFSNQYDPR
ncbi:MAG: helix-turn-helix domain-containing protein [Bacteroidota bacterium]